MKLGEITVRDVMIDDKPIDPEGRERKESDDQNRNIYKKFIHVCLF